MVPRRGPGSGVQSMYISSGKRSSFRTPLNPLSLIYTHYTDALREPRGYLGVPRARTYARKRSQLSPVCVCAPLLSLPLPFRELRALRRPGCRAATVTTNDGSLCWRGVGSLLVGVRRRVRVSSHPPRCTPANRRQISPGRLDACLRCLSSVPINIKPHSANEARYHPDNPTAAARCVHRYRGARARRIPGVPGFSLRLRIPVINVESRFP